MNSVLLVGDSSFTDGLRSQVRGIDSLTVTTTPSALEATVLLDRTVPDVVITQACCLTSKSVAKTFGSAQIPYITVIEISPLPNVSREALRTLQLEQTALAIESGADAYLWLSPTYEQAETSSQRITEHILKPAPMAAKVAIPNSISNTISNTTHTVSQRSPYPSPGDLTFTHDQCRLIQAHIQLGLSRGQRYRDLSRINDWLSAVALVDALTQLNNRRAFDLELPNQIQTARNNQTSLSLMVLDIDYFKSVNDRFGHLVGDEILKQLAKRLMKNMRFYDTPFRFGGEEFVVTLNSTDAVEGAAIADRLRKMIADEPFKLPYQINATRSIPITMSIGITELKAGDDAQGRSLLDRADQNLMKAKALGRNQVVATS